MRCRKAVAGVPDVTVNVAAVSVAGSIDSLKVALMLPFMGTLRAASSSRL